MPQPRDLLLGKSRAVATAMRLARQWAPFSDTILILGEPGTGKSVLAEHIHDLSGRTGQLVKESASNIPDTLVASILAGYRRGAFTGAVESRVGLIEAAHTGTFFLDEIGDASPELQLYLRREFDDSAVQRLGEPEISRCRYNRSCFGFWKPSACGGSARPRRSRLRSGSW